MFIHEPQYSALYGINSAKMDKAKGDLQIYKERIANYYTSRIEGLTKNEAYSLMEGEVTLRLRIWWENIIL